MNSSINGYELLGTLAFIEAPTKITHHIYKDKLGKVYHKNSSAPIPQCGWKGVKNFYCWAKTSSAFIFKEEDNFEGNV